MSRNDTGVAEAPESSLEHRMAEAIETSLRIAGELVQRNRNWLGDETRYSHTVELIGILNDALLDYAHITRRKLK